MIWDWHCWAMIDLFLSGLVMMLGMSKRRVVPGWWEWPLWPLAIWGMAVLLICDAVRWVVIWRRERIAQG